ncbi:MAG: DNA mismatch repair protein MutS, partial [Planctomycetota bacterium]
MARLVDELERIGPAEVLYKEDDFRCAAPTDAAWAVTHRPAWSYGLATAQETLCQQFNVANLEGFGFSQSDVGSNAKSTSKKSAGPTTAAVQAAGALLSYLQETQPGGLDHFNRLVPHQATATLQIDAATRRSLELTQTMRSGSREGSLLDTIDQTCTPGGARLLADWISAPLIDLHAIDARLDAVQHFANNHSLRGELRDALKQTFDLKRLLSRVATHRTGPRDLQQVGRTLEAVPALRTMLEECSPSLIQSIRDGLEECAPLRDELQRALADEVPISASDHHFIRDGYDDRLDELRRLAAGGRQWIDNYLQEIAESTGIANLKIGENSVF